MSRVPKGGHPKVYQQPPFPPATEDSSGALHHANVQRKPMWPIYEIRAADTEEGKQRERAYYEALGRFASKYAEAEAAVQRVLWYYAKTPEAIAKSIFSGTRVSTASDYIRRICEATDVDTEVLNEFEDLTSQLKTITRARDQIFHYGAESIAEGKGFVSNARSAHTPEKIVNFPISPDILSSMTEDLRKITACLLARHAGRPPLWAAENAHWLESLLHQPWQYKHVSSPPQKVRKPKDQGDPNHTVQPIPPVPSGGEC